jgi:hypothetical protein
MVMTTRGQRVQAAAHRRASTFVDDFAGVLKSLKTLVDPYRPELHYMRGPGPKWHAKHAQKAPAVDAAAVSGMARAKA